MNLLKYPISCRDLCFIGEERDMWSRLRSKDEKAYYIVDAAIPCSSRLKTVVATSPRSEIFEVIKLQGADLPFPS